MLGLRSTTLRRKPGLQFCSQGDIQTRNSVASTLVARAVRPPKASRHVQEGMESGPGRMHDVKGG